MLGGADGTQHPVPAVRALTDLWERTKVSARPGWNRRFLTLYRDFAAATARSVARLVETQNPDGGWGQLPGDPSDVLSTAQAVPVLARHGGLLSVHRAVTYLLDRQDADGGFTSVPDQVGPRPLPFDYPVLADIHALSALRRLPSELR
ncbi:hypothetical protein ACWEPN_44120 [Nonomuraea wenchangensis]